MSKWKPPTEKWTPPKDTHTPPKQGWTPPKADYKPPKSEWKPKKSDFKPPSDEWTAPKEKGPMGKLIEMGFTNRELNKNLLKKHNDDMEKVVQELLSQADTDWHSRRH